MPSSVTSDLRLPGVPPRAERIVEQHVLDVIRALFELHGFASIETRAVEPVERLVGKGGDADKEIYGVSRLAADASDTREPALGLHFDLTVPFARYVLENAGKLAFPFRRYQMQKVWRGERPQEGRYREFTQCDIDVVDVGELSPQFEIEMPLVLTDVFDRLPIGDYVIQVNNRKIPEGFYRGIGLSDVAGTLRIVDKLDKIGPETAVRAMLIDSGATPSRPTVPSRWRRSGPTTPASSTRCGRWASQDAAPRRGPGRRWRPSSRRATHAPGHAGRRPAARPGPGLLHRHRLRDPARRLRVVGARSLAAVATTRSPPTVAATYPGVGISIGVSRLLGLLLGRGACAPPARRPPCVLVAVNADEASRPRWPSRRRCGRAASPCEVAPAEKFGKQIRYADRRGIPFVWFPGSGRGGRLGQGHPLR